MEVNVSKRSLSNKPGAALLLSHFETCPDKLTNAIIFFDFPIYKDFDGKAIFVQALIASPEHGIIIFAIPDATKTGEHLLEELDQVVSLIHSRLIKNRNLRSGKLQLISQINSVVFSADTSFKLSNTDIPVIYNAKQLSELLENLKEEKALDTNKFSELISTIDGSKGLIRPKNRTDEDLDTKGYYIRALEDELALFDNKQRMGIVVPTDGPQRIRGIAGSGKTVILAMKAAITHLQSPEARIVYTFSTKSLYQHIKRLVTRFYRQFDDRDPNWENLKIMHAWGGRSYSGVYYEACLKHGSLPATYGGRLAEASRKGITVFDLVCKELKESVHLTPIYDYIFIDEGQDFPASFIDLCRQIAVNERILWAYDELQNIFNIKTPTQEEVFGRKEDGSPVAKIVEDIILYKSYRNPREILTAAHALGFGIYSGKIVQMFENREHWEDNGYSVVQGNCKVGELVKVERPEETSSRTISQNFKFDQIINCLVFEDFKEEISYISKCISNDIKKEGLRPDDILIEIVDDRYAQTYADEFQANLTKKGIPVNNVQHDKYGIIDFIMEGAVTISSVHKAKGNEAYQVYVVGVDAIFRNPDIVSRNRIFTAITRAKAWVTISGLGAAAGACAKEINEVSKNFPYLQFKYPSKQDIRVMHRDMTLAAKRRQVAERKIDEILKDLTPEQIKEYLKQYDKYKK